MSFPLFILIQHIAATGQNGLWLKFQRTYHKSYWTRTVQKWMMDGYISGLITWYQSKIWFSCYIVIVFLLPENWKLFLSGRTGPDDGPLSTEIISCWSNILNGHHRAKWSLIGLKKFKKPCLKPLEHIELKFDKNDWWSSIYLPHSLLTWHPIWLHYLSLILILVGHNRAYWFQSF